MSWFACDSGTVTNSTPFHSKSLGLDNKLYDHFTSHSSLNRIVMQRALLLFFIISNRLALICSVDQVQQGNKYLTNTHYV